MSWVIASEAREEMGKHGGQSRGGASATGRSCHGRRCARATHEEILHGTQGHRKSSRIRGILGPNQGSRGKKGGPERSSYMHSSVPGTEKSQEIPRAEWAQGTLRPPASCSWGGKPPEVGYLNMAWPETVLPEALHPHPLISLILVFIQKEFLYIYPASKGHEQPQK